MTQDEEQIKLLAVFHYIVAGLAGLISLFPIIHLCVGLYLVFGRQHMTGPGQTPPPIWIGWILVTVASLVIVAGMTLALFILFAGRCLAKRKHHTFCFVVACVECLFMPFGTVLGVFTIVALNKDLVKQLFNGPPVHSGN